VIKVIQGIQGGDMPPVGRNERVWLPVRLKNDEKLTHSEPNDEEVAVESLGEVGGGAEEEETWIGKGKGKERVTEETASTYQDTKQQGSGNTRAGTTLLRSSVLCWALVEDSVVQLVL
jgi:hypothetical protein